MRLRNKKTGEIKSIEEIIRDAFLYNELDSLKSIDANWEDYKPTEPLIKDEKIRKAVRAWAEAFGVTNAYVGGIGDGKDYIELYAQDNGVTDGRIRISISTQNGVWIGKEYSITELCGEEEE